MDFPRNAIDGARRVIRFGIVLVAALTVAACAGLNARNQPAASELATNSAPEKASAATANARADEKACRSMKSKDGSFEGCVYGNPPKNAKFSKLVIGMSKYQVEKLLGHPQDSKYVTNWRKAIIPFYQGTDARRLVWLYEGQGSVSFDTGGAYSDGGVVVEINYDPKIEL